MFQMKLLDCAILHSLSCLFSLRDREEMIPKEMNFSSMIQINYEAATEAIISLLHINHCPQVRVMFVNEDQDAHQNVVIQKHGIMPKVKVYSCLITD